MVPLAYNKMAILCWLNRHCKQHIANDERLWGMLMLMSMQMLLAETASDADACLSAGLVEAFGSDLGFWMMIPA